VPGRELLTEGLDGDGPAEPQRAAEGQKAAEKRRVPLRKQ
jgi:hypothetical protein